MFKRTFRPAAEIDFQRNSRKYKSIKTFGAEQGQNHTTFRTKGEEVTLYSTLVDPYAP